ncbi:MAG: exodeoxyribonuclease VII large subunit, partial [Perlucidibaca sp.]
MSTQPSPTVLTVSQLNGSVRELLEFNYGRIWLRGEISNLSAPSSGHLYFTLKDDAAQVRAAMFKGARVAARLQQPPRNGQQVLVRARVSLYAPRGDYQLLVEHLEDAGRGALQQAYEMLKARLAAEGLFAAERKR